jgi:hypothetical protein
MKIQRLSILSAEVFIPTKSDKGMLNIIAVCNKYLTLN